ncbi:helix-turn-helix domain-containing protein [Alicyclobacillus sp. SO9]|uniref:helix-turn-helix domain-containing protein n=1 Tax=Alicyclobacillus sp. SO9 TaxID=2665646 RepID=UPI0018E8E15E|nr:helix-turn-helix domain-containing protein [Alicyclobacillus sp. SO9]QQE80954.1 helix-turn-helix domain-containing protein [Alicyclobacillus sp. SO9]
MTPRDSSIPEARDYPITLTVSEVAEILRVDLHKAYSIVRDRDFPVITHGRRMIIPRDAFFRWLDGCGEERPMYDRNHVLETLADLVAERLNKRGT